MKHDRPRSSRSVALITATGPLRGAVRSALGGLDEAGSWTTTADVPPDVDQPDIVILAAASRRGKMLNDLADVRRLWPAADVVVVLKDSGRGATTIGILRDGASAIVLAAELDRSLRPTIDAVRAGQTCVPKQLRSDLVRPNLSRREKQTLGLVALGLSNAEIASQLHLTESTVKSHLSGAYRKLGVGSRSEAMTRLLDPDAGLGTGILKLSDTGV
jgi:DNA-binding NarL/FixJ family response regulator